ncbi:hypothetical protein R3W88_004909 [Solanum pinnatisectum]|uniref:Uncharacterized protein n=1 Tax=Solanum pinnatisectum TaxID=50273 RepID=A0AAV9KAL0_9SOLN|nr:hypothetical protein R3W88_004909 [Solanum pinnatisectum]
MSFHGKKNTSPNQQSCNSADHVEVEEKLVVDTNQSNDAQFAQRINEIKENEVTAENSSMKQGDKHTPEKLHDAIQTPKSNVQLENLAIDGQKKFEGSKYGNLQPLEPIDLQVEISALEVEKELELVDSNPRKEQTLVRADFDNNIQLVSTPTRVCSMQTNKMIIIQESETAMLLKPNSAIKSPMVTSNTLAHDISKEKQTELSTPRWGD